MRHEHWREKSGWRHAGRHGEHGGGASGSYSRRGGFGDGFGGHDDFSRGRKFSSDDLQVLLLALLVDAPRHGYELIKLLETRSNGFYTPSPGMVYPALTYLEELGYATVESEGNRKRYALTEAGRAYLEVNRERIDMMWAKLSYFARKIDMVRRALAGDEAGDDLGKNPLKALIEARHKLRSLLHRRMDAAPEEQARIAAILERASAEIESIDSH